MIDVISLSIAVGAVLVALSTHIKFSKCWGFEIATRTPTKSSPPDSPQLVETQPLLQNSPAIMEPTIPINIPPRPKSKIKNWL
jgi:hypothetical protein